MSTRRVKIKVKADNIREILDALDVVRFGEVELSLDLNDDPRVLEALHNNKNIICVNEENTHRSEPTKDNGLEIDYVDGFNSLATYIESVWTPLRENPNLTVSDKGINSRIKDVYTRLGNSEIALYHVALKAILESYYADNLENALKDTKTKLCDNWNILTDHVSIASVAGILYRKK